MKSMLMCTHQHSNMYPIGLHSTKETKTKKETLSTLRTSKYIKPILLPACKFNLAPTTKTGIVKEQLMNVSPCLALIF